MAWLPPGSDLSTPGTNTYIYLLNRVIISSILTHDDDAIVLNELCE